MRSSRRSRKVCAERSRQSGLPDAIRDGVLIDVTAVAREAGFKYSLALTAAAWAERVAVPPGVPCQDEAGRLWDTLRLLACIARRGSGGAEVRFGVHVRNDNRERATPLVRLKAVCGPGDGGETVLSVMMPDQDRRRRRGRA